jgi:hypothetical protein
MLNNWNSSEAKSLQNYLSSSGGKLINYLRENPVYQSEVSEARQLGQLEGWNKCLQILELLAFYEDEVKTENPESDVPDIVKKQGVDFD